VRRPYAPIAVAVLTLSCFMFFPSTAPAAVLVVHPDGSGRYPNIQAAINAALDGDTISLTNGLFTGPDNAEWEVIDKEITIQSESGAADSCVVDCVGGHVTGDHADAAIFCHKLSLPHARGFSGWYGVIEFYSCRFSGASNVLRMNAEWSAGRAYDCTFDSGTGCQLIGSADAFRCVFTNCVTPVTATFGLHSCRLVGNHGNAAVVHFGFVSATEPWLNLEGCSFLNNDAPACAQGRGGLYVDSCLFANNSGPAIDLGTYWGGNLELSRSTLVANSGPAQIRLDASEYRQLTATIDRTIIVSAPQGCALSCNGDVAITPSCCDLYGNEGGDWTGCIADQGTIANNFSADPVFCGDPWDPFTLCDNSPCATGPCGIIGVRPVGCLQVSSAPVAAVGRFDSRVTMIPNPARGAATILLHLAPGGATHEGPPARLSVYDAGGGLVRSIKLSDRAADWKSATGARTLTIDWDGRDLTGRPLASGVYRIVAESASGHGQGAIGSFVVLR
jgi:hypothetical protein